MAGTTIHSYAKNNGTARVSVEYENGQRRSGNFTSFPDLTDTHAAAVAFLARYQAARWADLPNRKSVSDDQQNITASDAASLTRTRIVHSPTNVSESRMNKAYDAPWFTAFADMSVLCALSCIMLTLQTGSARSRPSLNPALNVEAETSGPAVTPMRPESSSSASTAGTNRKRRRHGSPEEVSGIGFAVPPGAAFHMADASHLGRSDGAVHDSVRRLRGP